MRPVAYSKRRAPPYSPRLASNAMTDEDKLILALNKLPRPSATQRAFTGARLNLDCGIRQEDAAKMVGVSKLHVNLVAQAMRCNNPVIAKLLEYPDLTREMLREEMQRLGVIKKDGGTHAT